jgi:hypothetical protein
VAVRIPATSANLSVGHPRRGQLDRVLGWRKHRGISDSVAFLVVLAAYASLELQDLRLPGLYYDELIQVVPALDVALGGLWSSVNWVPLAQVSLFGHTLPLMTMDYMGSLKTFVFIPIVAAVGVSPESLRITTVVIGALSLLATFAFVRRVVGLPVALVTVALLATDLSFVYYVRVDYGPTALMMLLKTVALWQLAVWWQTGRVTGLILGVLALGLGVYNKADFVWIVFGTVGAAVLVAPIGIRARATLRAAAYASGAFVLGAAPLIYFNFKWPMPTLAALSGPATAGGPSGGFGAQFMERVGVLEHLLDGGHIIGGATAIGPTSGVVVVLVVVSAVLALVGTTPHLRTRGWRVTLFALVATLLILVAAAATRGGFAGHHVILTYPFPHLLAAGGVFNLVQWTCPRFGSRLVVGTATALAVLAAGQNWLTTDGYLSKLRSTGGAGNFSDAIYTLADVLQRQELDAPVVDLDWGFHFPLVGLSQGSIHSVEVMDGSTAELRRFIANPRVQYVAHAPGAANFPRGFQAFTAAAQGAGLQVVREQRFETRDGKPVIDLYAVRPAANQPNSGSLIVEQGRGTVGPMRSDDQVRLITDASNSGLTLLTIAASRTSYSISVPAQAQLSFAVAQPENVWPVTTGATATVTVIDGDRRVEMFRRRLAARDVTADRTWSDVVLDLSAFTGRAVLVEFAAVPAPDGDNASWVIWREPSLVSSASSSPPTP